MLTQVLGITFLIIVGIASQIIVHIEENKLTNYKGEHNNEDY